jgi:hypothetical protein
MPSTFHIFSEPKHTSVITPWDAIVGRYSRIIGYTSFGDFFVTDPPTSEHALLLTLEGSVEETGYDDTDAFVSTLLTVPDVVAHVLRPQLLEALTLRLGPLCKEEVYYPVPYPFIGGSGAPETFEKGNVWVFASIAGQSRGSQIHEI